ncbi:hypothetical protein CLOP_g19221, partial [Closterium sp. NIES-67]
LFLFSTRRSPRVYRHTNILDQEAWAVPFVESVAMDLDSMSPDNVASQLLDLIRTRRQPIPQQSLPRSQAPSIPSPRSQAPSQPSSAGEMQRNVSQSALRSPLHASCSSSKLDSASDVRSSSAVQSNSAVFGSAHVSANHSPGPRSAAAEVSSSQATPSASAHVGLRAQPAEEPPSGKRMRTDTGAVDAPGGVGEFGPTTPEHTGSESSARSGSWDVSNVQIAQLLQEMDMFFPPDDDDLGAFATLAFHDDPFDADIAANAIAAASDGGPALPAQDSIGDILTGLASASPPHAALPAAGPSVPAGPVPDVHAMRRADSADSAGVTPRSQSGLGSPHSSLSTGVAGGSTGGSTGAPTLTSFESAQLRGDFSRVCWVGGAERAAEGEAAEQGGGGELVMELAGSAGSGESTGALPKQVPATPALPGGGSGGIHGAGGSSGSGGRGGAIPGARSLSLGSQFRRQQMVHAQPAVPPNPPPGQAAQQQAAQQQVAQQQAAQQQAGLRSTGAMPPPAMPPRYQQQQQQLGQQGQQGEQGEQGPYGVGSPPGLNHAGGAPGVGGGRGSLLRVPSDYLRLLAERQGGGKRQRRGEREWHAQQVDRLLLEQQAQQAQQRMQWQQQQQQAQQQQQQAQQQQQQEAMQQQWQQQQQQQQQQQAALELPSVLSAGMKSDSVASADITSLLESYPLQPPHPPPPDTPSLHCAPPLPPLATPQHPPQAQQPRPLHSQPQHLLQSQQQHSLLAQQQHSLQAQQQHSLQAQQQRSLQAQQQHSLQAQQQHSLQAQQQHSLQAQQQHLLQAHQHHSSQSQQQQGWSQPPQFPPQPARQSLNALPSMQTTHGMQVATVMHPSQATQVTPSPVSPAVHALPAQPPAQEAARDSSQNGVSPPQGPPMADAASLVPPLPPPFRAVTSPMEKALMECAAAVDRRDLGQAHSLMSALAHLVSPHGTAQQRLGYYFLEALAARIAGTGSAIYKALQSRQGSQPGPSSKAMLSAVLVFCEACPWINFGHLVANGSILEAVEGAKRVHVIDLGITHGTQWPTLLESLATRPGGPPHLRITGVDAPLTGLKPSSLEETGRRLSSFARVIGVPFEFTPITDALDDVRPEQLGVRSDEVLVVNCLLRLHQMRDYSTQPGAPSQRNFTLQMIRSLNPTIVTLIEQHADHNIPSFLSRFREALHYFSALFESLDASLPWNSTERALVEERIFGRKLVNIIACEGRERVERHESHARWQQRMQRCGFLPRPVSADVEENAHLLLKRYREGYGIERRGDALIITWRSEPFFAASNWRCAPPSAAPTAGAASPSAAAAAAGVSSRSTIAAPPPTTATLSHPAPSSSASTGTVPASS